MEIKRNYQGKDVEMLTTCSVIIENGIKNQDYLIKKRQSWTEEFFSSIKTGIEHAFSVYLGIDNAAEQRKATQQVTQIQNVALNDLAELKIQIEEDFKSDKLRRDELLKLLGYTSHHKAARGRDQEALVEFLYQFKTNLTAKIREEIVKKGINEDIVTRICTYADDLSNANISQEVLKGSRKIITEKGISELNAIYNEVISIAKIARNFYKGNPNKQDEFSYSKIRKKLNSTSENPEEETV